MTDSNLRERLSNPGWYKRLQIQVSNKRFTNVLIVVLLFWGVNDWVYLFNGSVWPTISTNPWWVYIEASIAFVLFAWLSANTNQPTADTARMWESYLKIALDIGLAALISWFLWRTGLLNGSANSSNSPLDPFSFIMAFVVGLTVMALASVAGAAGVTDQLKAYSEKMALLTTSLGKNDLVSKDNANKLSNTADLIKKVEESLRQVSQDVRDNAVFAQFLGIENKRLESDNPTMRDALQSSVDTMRRWVKIGEELLGDETPVSEAPHPERQALSDSWWRIMETYNREERYDVVRNELVTNVRNYAFLILSLIQEHIKAAEAHNKALAAHNQSSSDKQWRVVVFQATPFAPKDFYNFPNGPRGRRYYYDQYFFGSYRRILAYYLSLKSVCVRRVLLCAGDSSDKPDVGWPLDNGHEFVVGCKFMNVIPGAYPVIKTEDVIEPLLIKSWQKYHNPSARLGKKEEFSWVPVYPRAKWQKLLDRCEHKFPENMWSKLGSDIGIRRVEDGTLVMRQGNDQNGLKMNDFIETVKLKELEVWQALEAECTKFQDSVRGTSPKTTQIRRLYAVLQGKRQLWSDSSSESYLNIAHSEHASLFGLVQDVQEMDALLSDGRRPPLGPRKQPVGWAERWFYWWLVHLEQAASDQDLWQEGANCDLPTIWDRFQFDVLGLRGANLNSSDVVEKVRIAPLWSPLSKPDSKYAIPECRDMEKLEIRGILPEFLLIGFEKGKGSAVEWQALFGSEISEPFSAARVLFDFAHPKPGTLLKTHGDWAEEIWKQEDDDPLIKITRAFVDLMAAADDASPVDFLNAIDKSQFSS